MKARLARYLEERRALIDDFLSRCLPEPPTCPAIVAEAMRYSVMGGGKRLRPILTIAAAEAVHATRPSAHRDSHDPTALALPSGCAIELVHTYSLIHDDLPAMDNDAMRRGRPTSHVVYGEGIAILAGDGLLAEAFVLMAREPRSASPPEPLVDRKLRVIRRVAEAAGATGMVGGQAIDLKAAGGASNMTEVELRQMHAMKTGALIRASAVAGAIMGGGNDPLVEAVDRFAAELGLAFQITDDILDVEATSEQMGKKTGKDAALGKSTYVTRFGLDRSRQMAAECVEQARSTLERAGLLDGHLLDIAEWVVERRT